MTTPKRVGQLTGCLSQTSTCVAEMATRRKPTDRGTSAQHSSGPDRHSDNSPVIAPGGLERRGYQIINEIARGGMGVVYRVLDLKFQRLLALKLLLPEVVSDARTEFRFLREAQITGQLQHPGVPPVHDQGYLEGPGPYFTMKLIEGETLSDLLQNRTHPARDLPRFLAIFEQICQTIGYAHSQGIVHRDLKPSNVMVGGFGEVQVMDWGLAKTLRKPHDQATAPNRETDPEPKLPAIPKPESPEDLRTTEVSETRGKILATPRGAGANLVQAAPDDETDAPADRSVTYVVENGAEKNEGTLFGSVCGSPAYMAPEQARGAIDEIDERTDVFGLGAILCVMLTGKPPYEGSSALEVSHRAKAGDLSATFEELERSQTDPDLVALAKKCLATNQNDRFRTAGEVSEAVEAYQIRVQERMRETELRTAAAEARANAERSRRRMLLASMTLLCFLMASLGGVMAVFLNLREVRRQAEERKLRENQRLALAKAKIAEAIEEGHRVVDDLITQLGQNEKAFEVVQNPAPFVRRIDVATVCWTRARELHENAKIPIGQARRRQLSDLKRKLDALQTAIGHAIALNQIREERSALAGGKFNHQLALRQYQAEFQKAGFDVPHQDPGQVAKRIRQSPIRGIWVDALGDWALLLWHQENTRRSSARGTQNKQKPANLALVRCLAVGPEEPPEGERIAAGGDDGIGATVEPSCKPEQLRRKILDLAHRVETHPARKKLYDQKLWDEPKRIRQLALDLLNSPSEFAKLPPQTVGFVGALLRRAEKEQAKKWFRKAALQHPQDFWINCSLGGTLFRTSLPPSHPELAEALAAFRGALAVRPRSPAAWNNIASVLSGQGKLEESVQAYNKALEIDPNFKMALSNLGVVLRKQKKFQQAIGIYRKVLKLDPEYEEAWLNLGNTFLAQKKLDAAAGAYEKALRVNSKYQSALSNLGIVFAMQGKLEESVKFFRKATTADPWCPMAWSNLGNALRLQRKFEESIAAYKRAVLVDPQFATGWSNLGNAYLSQRNLEDAIRSYRKAVEVDPQHKQAWLGLGMVLRTRGETDEAMSALKKATQLSPGKKEAWFYLASVLMQNKQFDKAAWAYRNTLKIAPRWKQAWYNLGQALSAQQNFPQAVQAYTQALRIDPKYSRASAKLRLARQAQERLVKATGESGNESLNVPDVPNEGTKKK